MTEMSVRQWQERFRAGDFSSKDRAVQCEAGWYDWFCQDVALAGRLQKLSKVVMGITDPYILDHYYVWFKNNCPLSGPLYDDIRFEPLHGDRSGKYFVVIRDSPHEAHKWTLYTERHGFEQPEFTCGNVRDMLRHINSMAPRSPGVVIRRPKKRCILLKRSERRQSDEPGKTRGAKPTVRPDCRQRRSRRSWRRCSREWRSIPARSPRS